MNLIDRIVEDDNRLSERLLDAAAQLSEEALDEPVLVSPPSKGFGEQAPSLRAMLDRLVYAKELLVASIGERAFDSWPDTSMAGLCARLERADASLAGLVRKIGEHEKWDAVFIDLTDGLPATDTFGAAIERVLESNAVRRDIIAGALSFRGVKVPRRVTRVAFDLSRAEVARKLQSARQELEVGHGAKAAKILDDLVYRTHNPDLLTQIHELGHRELQHAGRLQRVTWRDIVKESEARLQRPDVV